MKMKKTFLSIAAFAILALIFSGPAWPDACTVSGAVFESSDNIAINWECVGAVADGSVTDTSFDVSGMSGKLRGFYLFECETIPGTGDEVPLAYIPKIVNARGTELFAPTSRSTTEKEIAYPVGAYHLIDSKLTLKSSDIGAGNKFNIITKFAR